MVHFLLLLFAYRIHSLTHLDTRHRNKQQQPYPRTLVWRGNWERKKKGDAADCNPEGTTWPRITWFSPPPFSTLSLLANESTMDFDTLA
ncbi:hypothetical protein BKA57DRAFT_156361 [Linnemannia elongata]|nr:hypothetical protein BKA57DRAFT_156361 [Linnemannia elongata]